MTHDQAREVIRQAWRKVYGADPSPSELAYTQAIAWFENRYGRAGQFAKYAEDGQYNWGSLHASGTPPNCPAGSVEGYDLRPVCFLVFPSDVDAAASYVRNLTQNAKYGRERVRAAMSGSATDVAQAMYDSKYYEGAPGKSDAEHVAAYANGIQSAVTATGGSGGVSDPARSGSSTFWPVALALGAAGTAYWAYYRGGDRVLASYAHQALRSLSSFSRRLT